MPFGDHPGAMDARQPRAGNDAFAGHAAVRALEMRPDRVFFRPRSGPKSIWQASEDTGVKRPSASTKRRDAEARARARGSPAGRPARTRAGRCAAPRPSGIAGSDSACASKSLSSRPCFEAGAARGLRPVHHPGRVGELERPSDDRPRAAGDHRARPGRELGRGRLDRLRQARIVAGAQMDDVAQSGAPGSVARAKRTLVPPVSQTRTGKGKANSVMAGS